MVDADLLHQDDDALDLVGGDLALVRAAERARHRRAHLDAVRHAPPPTTGAKRSMLSAIEQLMLRWLKASLAAAKTTISSAPLVAQRASKPFRFGVSTE